MRIIHSLIFTILPLGVSAQIYTPGGTVQAVSNGTNNVGIGVEKPANPLDIEGSISELNILVKNTGTNGARTYLSSFSGKSSIQTDKDFTIRTNYGGSWKDRFILTHAGNVGIGADIPKARFDLGSHGGVMFRLHPGSQTFVDFSPYLHHDFLQGSYLQDGLSQAFISTGYVQDGRRKFHIGSANSSDFATATFQPHFTVTSGGNVGVGITDPSSRFQIKTVNSAAMKIERANCNVFGFEIGSSTFGLYDYTTLKYQWRTAAGNLYLLESGGNIGVGTTDTHGYKLAVAGKTITEEVVVKLQGNWPDYVFDKQYQLRSLSDLERFIAQHKHLPEVPTAKEVQEEGLSIGVMNGMLLKKVEELTLYLIKQNAKIDQLESRLEQMEK